MKTLPAITNKQQDILRLIYRYRFINRIQIQALLGHKDKRRSSRWLKDLKDKSYISWIYDDSSLISKTTPATYYLGINGFRFLRSLGEYPPKELRKRYKESSRKPDFIARSLLVAECGVNLESSTVGGTHYSFVTHSAYTDSENDYNFLTELQPHLCFTKETPKTKDNYLVEFFDATTPRYMVKKRLKDYVEFLDDTIWENETEDKDPPIVMIACPSTAELIYAKRRTRKLLEDTWGEDIPEDIIMRFSTTAKVKSEGVTGTIWEDA